MSQENRKRNFTIVISSKYTTNVYRAYYSSYSGCLVGIREYFKFHPSVTTKHSHKFHRRSSYIEIFHYAKRIANKYSGGYNIIDLRNLE